MKKHIENFEKSFNLSRQQINEVVNPIEVAALFESRKISYVLIGAHMIAYYTGTARATVDVDFIIGGTDFKQATRIIDEAYSQLNRHDRVYHVTYDAMAPDTNEPERIDLVKDDFPLFSTIVQNYCLTLRDKESQIKIPTIEAAIALKFAAAISPNRSDENKPVDHADLTRLIRSTSRLDENALQILGELIYPGGGKELISTIKEVQQGKSIIL